MGENPVVQPNSQVNPNGGANNGELNKGLSDNSGLNKQPDQSSNPNQGN